MISGTPSRKLEEGQTGGNGLSLRLRPEGKSKTLPRNSRGFDLRELTRVFPRQWSDYVLLVRRAHSPEALAFYQTEALRGGFQLG